MRIEKKKENPPLKKMNGDKRVTMEQRKASNEGVRIPRDAICSLKCLGSPDIGKLLNHYQSDCFATCKHLRYEKVNGIRKPWCSIGMQVEIYEERKPRDRYQFWADTLKIK